jgi:hypothetical protein
MSTAPRRRWFRFSLRTLFLLVALIAAPLAWLGVQLKWIHDRHEAAAWASDHQSAGPFPQKTTPAPWSIRILGESDGLRSMDVCAFTPEDREQVAKLERLFPERKISIRNALGD